MKLEQLVASIIPLHQEEFQPAARTATITLNSAEHQPIRDATTKAIKMGLFYETLTTLFFGGVLGKYFSSITDELDLLTKPDLVNHDTKKFLECKSVCAGQHCMLLDTQLQGYDALQEHFPNYSTSFALYRHTLRGIKSSWQGTAKELFQELTGKTAYLVLLPYSIVQEFQTIGQSAVHSSLVYRYSHPQLAYDSCTCIRSSTITRLATEPESVIADLHLDPEKFLIARYRSPVCKINRFVVESFPMIAIHDLEQQQNQTSSSDEVNLPF